MRIALLSDIHGNKIALEAVLADIEAIQGVDEYWVLGDLAALGPEPAGVLQCIAALPNCHIVRGNTERYLVTGDRPPPFLNDLGSDIEKIKLFAEVASSFGWTLGAVTATGWLEWISQLPLEMHKTLPDGTQCLLVHASPGYDNANALDQNLPDADIRAILTGCSAGLVCVGHTHLAIDRKVDHWHIVNPGSISNPFPPDLRASYAILDATPEGYTVEHRRVEYDQEAVISQLHAIKHPGADHIIKYMLGLQT